MQETCYWNFPLVADGPPILTDIFSRQRRHRPKELVALCAKSSALELTAARLRNPNMVALEQTLEAEGKERYTETFNL
jgi:hypothetical protein